MLAIVIRNSMVITVAKCHTGICHLRMTVTTTMVMHWPMIASPRSSKTRRILKACGDIGCLAGRVFNKTPNKQQGNKRHKLSYRVETAPKTPDVPG